MNTAFKEGDSASFSKTITEADILLYAGVSGDTNPLHLDAEYAATTRFGERIAHGMLTAGLISAVLGTKLPGPGAIYVGQTLWFRRPVYIGDTVTATATITEYDREHGRMVIETICRNQRGEEVLDGEANVIYRPKPAGPRPNVASSIAGSAQNEREVES
ncbi:MAG TPA: MaoC family dehydratase [Chloroflexota bacterium]|nr:MaoC family dehydratase [Chloroflexota bacterium]